MALAGLAGCGRRQPPESIVPYVRQPEDVLPGEPGHYATTFCWDGYGRGLVVEAHEGRPTKIEGNPDHDSSLGASDAVMQAAVLELYDPDRLMAPRWRVGPCHGVPSTRPGRLYACASGTGGEDFGSSPLRRLRRPGSH
jgi:anaerobic selenocysteine-containing dehydrogenase